MKAFTVGGEEELVEREWTFKYRTLNAKNKLGGVWIDHHGEERVFSAIPRGATPGTKWMVPCIEAGNQAAMKAAYYKGTTVGKQGDQMLAAWRLRDTASKTEKAKESKLKKLGGHENLGDITLDQVRRTMGTSWTQRSAMLAVVLDYLTAD